MGGRGRARGSSRCGTRALSSSASSAAAAAAAPTRLHSAARGGARSQVACGDAPLRHALQPDRRALHRAGQHKGRHMLASGRGAAAAAGCAGARLHADAGKGGAAVAAGARLRELAQHQPPAAVLHKLKLQLPQLPGRLAAVQRECHKAIWTVLTACACHAGPVTCNTNVGRWYVRWGAVGFPILATEDERAQQAGRAWPCPLLEPLFACCRSSHAPLIDPWCMPSVWRR